MMSMNVNRGIEGSSMFKQHLVLILSVIALTATTGCTKSKRNVDTGTVAPGDTNKDKNDLGTNPDDSSFSGEQGNDFGTPSETDNSGQTQQITVVTDANGAAKVDASRSNTTTPTGPDASGKVQYKPFSGTVTDAQIQQWVEADKTKRGEDAANWRYTFIPTEFLANKEEANRARVGLSKALNHVAVAATEIHNPVDVSDGNGIVFAVPIAKYWGAEAARKWEFAAQAQGRRPFSPAPRLDLRPFPANAPVSADRLAYNILHGAVYNELIDTPQGNGAGRKLREQLGVGRGTPSTANMGVKHAITYSPRLLRRYKIPGRPGAYWESMDEFNGRSRELIWLNGSIPQDRGDGMIRDFGTVASETWYHMKNGMPAYFIFGNANQERTKAEQSFVTDPLNKKDGQLVTGFCVFCHIAGVQHAPNDMWTALEEGRVTGNVERARQYWTSNDDVAKVYKEDRDIIVNALRTIVTGMSDMDAKWNEAQIQGADPKEPSFFLVSTVSGNRLKGDTTGLQRRDSNGNIPGLNNGRGGRR
jgi:hypothetical protein